MRRQGRRVPLHVQVDLGDVLAKRLLAAVAGVRDRPVRLRRLSAGAGDLHVADGLRGLRHHVLLADAVLEDFLDVLRRHALMPRARVRLDLQDLGFWRIMRPRHDAAVARVTTGALPRRHAEVLARRIARRLLNHRRISGLRRVHSFPGLIRSVPSKEIQLLRRRVVACGGRGAEGRVRVHQLGHSAGVRLRDVRASAQLVHGRLCVL